MPLAGDLSDMALTDLIQITCQEQRRARLVVHRAGEEAEIYFDGGEIVHARLGDLVGEHAIYRALHWQDGRFDLESDVAPPQPNVNTPWSALLMSGLQQYDEALWDDHADTAREMQTMASQQDLLAEMGEEIEGFMAAAVIGMDGLPIAQHVAAAGVEIEGVSAQMTMFMRLVQTSAEKLDAGQVEDDLLTTEKVYFLTRFLANSDYYLGIVANRAKANLGNMRLYSRIYAQKLSDAMPR